MGHTTQAIRALRRMQERSASDLLGFLEESPKADLRVRADDLVFKGCWFIPGPEGDPHPAAIFEDTKAPDYIAAVWWWDTWQTSLLMAEILDGAESCGAVLDGEDE